MSKSIEPGSSYLSRGRFCGEPTEPKLSGLLLHRELELAV